MKKIFKQVIECNSVSDGLFPIEFTAPKDARPISVAMQNDKICMWFECTPDAPKERLYVYSVGTGYGMVPEEARFIGTVVDGAYVWHIYSMTK